MNYQNDQATSLSANASGKNVVRMICEMDRDKSNPNSWLTPAIGSMNNDIEELKSKSKIIEDGIKKIETGVREDGFDRVEYNASYQSLFVRGNENASNSARRFLNQCLNEDLKKIGDINYDINRIRSNLDAHLSTIPKEHIWIEGSYKDLYNKELTKIQNLERHYYGSFNTMSGVEPETNNVSDSESGSEYESE